MGAVGHPPCFYLSVNSVFEVLSGVLVEPLVVHKGSSNGFILGCRCELSLGFRCDVPLCLLEEAGIVLWVVVAEIVCNNLSYLIFRVHHLQEDVLFCFSADHNPVCLQE